VKNTLVDELQLPFVTNGVTSTTTGRLFMVISHIDGSAGPRVVEWHDGKAVPYPNEQWNSKASSSNAASRLVLVNSLRIGPDGDLWLVDVGSPAMGKPKLPHGPKLVHVDIGKNTVRHVYDLDGLTGAKSFVDDVRFHGRTAYLTDAGIPGIIVLDLDTGTGHRVLEGTPAVTATKPISAEGHVLHDMDDKPVYVHADQLEVSPDGRWLYYQPASGPLFRIETRWLAPQVQESDRVKHVERVAATPSTGGTAIDSDGNIYLSDTDEQRILKISPTGTITILFHDARLTWVDAMWIDSQGFLWMPAAQLNRMSIFHQGESKVMFPVHVFKLQINARPAKNDHR
jgi:sugar lactone lactonase YvrE